MTGATGLTEEAPKCPRNFGIWIAFLAGMVVMVVAAVVFDNVSGKSRTGFEVEESQYGQGVVTTSSVVVADQREEGIPWLGIEVQEINAVIAEDLGLNGDCRILVTEVAEASPAEAGGIKRGDVIVMFDRRWVTDIQSLKTLLAETSVDDRVKVDVIRDEERKVFYVKIGSRPDDNTSFQLIQGQPEETGQSGSLGMMVSPITPQLAQRFGAQQGGQGVMVVDVAPNSLAQQAGLQPGDVITGVDGQSTQDMASFFAEMDTEDAVLLDILRQGEDEYIIIDSTSAASGLPSTSGVILTGGSSDDEEEGSDGYQGKPPIIPPLGKPPEPEI